MEASMLQNVPLKPRNYNYSDHNHKPLTNYFDIVDSASLYARVNSFSRVTAHDVGHDIWESIN